LQFHIEQNKKKMVVSTRSVNYEEEIQKKKNLQEQRRLKFEEDYKKFVDDEEYWQNWTDAKERFDYLMKNIYMAIVHYERSKGICGTAWFLKEQETIQWIKSAKLNFSGYQKENERYVEIYMLTNLGYEGYNKTFTDNQSDIYILLYLASSFI